MSPCFIVRALLGFMFLYGTDITLYVKVHIIIINRLIVSMQTASELVISKTSLS